MRTLHFLDKQLGRATGLFAILGSISTLALMLLIMVGVFFRYALNNPIFGIGDLSTLALSVLAASSIFYGARNDAHVNVDLIDYFFGPKVTRVTDMMMSVLAIFILGLATYALFAKACGFEKACLTENLSIVHRPFFYVLGVSFGLYTLHFLHRFIAQILNWDQTLSLEVDS